MSIRTFRKFLLASSLFFLAIPALAETTDEDGHRRYLPKEASK